ncbi:phospholipid-transporting ATPase ABCA1-like [Sabethes cyaneus]|uniref:phospholipid-transporting ATPase ABCA1-like n=1 Tax=Sabethes cyaneus TaxID=53552 RepID=UPI00237E1A04|nr:phospholipid-transporting ATPase ABCA1-like [Sabethes cyaneus]
MTSCWNKFTLLLWKNSLIHRRHYVRSAFDILLPILFSSVVLLIPTEELKRKPVQNAAEEFNVMNYEFHPLLESKRTLLYYPQSNLVDDMVREVAAKLQIENARPVESLESLKALLEESKAFAGIAFENTLQTAYQLPEKISYSILLQTSGSLFEEDTTRKSLVIQSAIFEALLRRLAPGTELPPISVKLRDFSLMLFMLMLMAFSSVCLNTVKYVCIEKERQLKEAMKVMGLQSWIHWAAWFAEVLLMLMISISVITYIFTYWQISILQQSSWMLIWMFLFAYSIALIWFSFLITVFFKKASIAAIAAGLIYFACAAVISSTDRSQQRIAGSLLFNIAFGYGLEAMLYHETAGDGLTWSTLDDGTKFCHEYSLGIAIGMLLLDATLYAITALYVEQVLPGAYGIPKPWYFPFTRSFWVKARNKQVTVTLVDPPRSSYYEDDPVSARAGIQIRNLSKVFRGGKIAVANLTLNLYENHITVLLGHNGAGKTTLISMLTGMLSATSGSALINGYDLGHAERFRTSLGFCPQHNVIFEELTVSEHLIFAARLKGVARAEISETVYRYVSLIGLKDHRNARSGSLSGGIKRKLSIGMAFVGSSKVVLLDEPTAGVDPAARRSIWDFLLAQKKHRTILLSTHFMDEADILGDRIAIMADGNLTAVGSPFFLKQCFGVGYRLICVKGTNPKVDKVMKILHTFHDDVKIDAETNTEVSFILRQGSAQNMEKLLNQIDAELEACGMKSYGIGLTTMEDVFLKAGSDSFVLKSSEDLHQIDLTVETSYAGKQVKLLKGVRLTINRIKALFLKKRICTKRSWIKHAIQILLPAAITSLLLMNHLEDPSLKTSVNILDNQIGEQPVVDNYRQLVGSRHLSETPFDMFELINRKLIETDSFDDNQLRIGATFSNNGYTAWFNGMDTSLATESLNHLHNAVLQLNCPFCRITASIQITDKHEHPINIVYLIITVLFTISFISAMFISFYIRERVSQVKLQQLLTGLSSELFWIVNFVYDLVTFALAIILLISIIVYFKVPGWSEPTSAALLSLIFALYAWAFLPQTYLLSFWIKTPASGVTKLLLLNLFAGVLVSLVSAMLLYYKQNFTANTVVQAMHFLPIFTLFKILTKFGSQPNTSEQCFFECYETSKCSIQTICEHLPKCCNKMDLLTFEDNGILRELSHLLAVGVLCWILIGCIEHKLHRKLLCRRPIRASTRDLYNTDSDVLEEKLRISKMTQEEIGQHSVVLKNLSKRYGMNPAVKRLSVAMDAGECFGLLGMNGAGKTTTFKMLVGDESITSGKIWFNGVDVRSTNVNVGYCSQFGGLLNELTGAETVRIFALLRGVHGDDVKKMISGLAEDLSFSKHLDVRTKNYSIGNQRKLSTALAIMSPSIILLDEPSSGLDPGAKRRLWNVINRVREAGRTIVLTTHSMDECEALCTRLSIMVNGELKCLGSTQHLKNRFSQGFMINVKMQKSDDLKSNISDVKDFIKKRFSDAQLREAHDEYLSFFIPPTQQKWSKMFGIMDASKNSLSIEDYTICQTTLEQVFLHFTKNRKQQ